jgi:DNA-binding transcriptional ArsR family regulator
MPDPLSPQAALDAVFLALSDERRRDMVSRLSACPLSVKDLAGPLGLRLPSALKHLAVLEDGGLVVSQKAGRVRTFALKPRAFDSISQWIAAREVVLTAAFDRLDAAIAQFPEEAE